MRKIFVSLEERVINYASRIGGNNLSIGLNKIVQEYMDADIDNITPEDKLSDDIAATPVAPKSRELPVSVLDALSAITAEGERAAVENGKVMVEEKGKATLYEYSKYSMCLHGDTKPEEVQNYIRSITDKERKPQHGCKKLPGAEWVWMIPKSAVEKQGGVEKLIAAFAKVGLTVTLGNSLYTDEERAEDEAKSKKKAEAKAEVKAEPKAEPKAEVKAEEKPVSNNTLHLPNYKDLEESTENYCYFKDECITNLVVKEVPTARGMNDGELDCTKSVWYAEHKGKTYLFGWAGETSDGSDVFYYIAAAKTVNNVALENGGTLIGHDKMMAFVEDGVCQAYAKGVIKTIHQYLIDAYAQCEGMADHVKYLTENMAKAA